MQVFCTHLTLRNSIEKPLLARLAIYMYTCHHWPFIFKELWGELSLDPMNWKCLNLMFNTISHESWVIFRILRVLFSHFLVGGWTNPSEKYSSNWMISPIFGVEIKHIWNHNLVIFISLLHTRNLTWNLKMMVSNRNLLFQELIFRFHVSSTGCILCWENPWNQTPPPSNKPRHRAKGYGNSPHND